jgi:hypothetical protein
MVNQFSFQKKKSLCEVFTETEKFFKLDIGTGLNIYKNLAYRKKIVFDINQSIDFSEFVAGGKNCE